MASWYARKVRTATCLRLNGDQDTGHIVRVVLRFTKAAKSAVGRDVELHLTAAEARDLARELTDYADRAGRTNKEIGYRIDSPRA